MEHAAVQHVGIGYPQQAAQMNTRVTEIISATGEFPQEPSPRREPEISLCTIGGRLFRVFQWRAAQTSSRRPLLFFSGIGSNAEILAPFMARLSDRDVITFDMPGIGGSSRSGGPYRLSSMARDSAALLDRLGHDRVDVMGVSWGGMMAQEFAHQLPHRLGRLILAGTTVGIVMVPGRLSALSMMLNLRRFNDADFLRRHFDTLYGGGNLGWEKYAAGVQAPSAVGYLYQLGALTGWTSLGFLHEIKAGTLVLGGTDDSLVRPVNLHVLHSQLPNSKLRFIQGAGHMFLLSHLEEAALDVEVFLDEPDTNDP